MTEAGGLKEAFLAVVNTQPADERVIAKNAERVVAARLRDAKFFWEADRAHTLESRLDRLHTVLFHKKLGSYRDKAERIEKLAAWIATEAFGRPDVAEHAATAARLAKTDLTSDMVFEFPELQGTMGGIYAREEGQPEQVWKAIYHHYLPIGVEADAPPSKAQLGDAAATWAAVSLADKLDTVVGLTDAGEKSTGSRDPFGLRRQMHGIVRILMDLPELVGVNRELGLRDLVAAADKGFGQRRRLRGCRCGRRVRARSRALCARAARLSRRKSSAAPCRPRATSCRCVRCASRRRCSGCAAPRTSRRWRSLFKRVKNIARELKAQGAARARRRSTEPAELALLAELDARRPRIEQAAASGGLSSGVHRAGRSAAGRRSILHRSVRHGRRRAAADGAADADGGLAQSHSPARRHLGNRSSNGVGQVDMAKKLARKKSARSTEGRSRRRARRPRRSGRLRRPRPRRRGSTSTSSAARRTATVR